MKKQKNCTDEHSQVPTEVSPTTVGEEDDQVWKSRPTLW